MAAPSTYKLLLQAQQAIKQLQRDLYVSKGFTIQQCIDMAMIALHEEFGFGPKYQARFEEAFRKTFVEYATICVEDGADDEKRMYFRDSRKNWEKGSVRK